MNFFYYKIRCLKKVGPLKTSTLPLLNPSSLLEITLQGDGVYGRDYVVFASKVNSRPNKMSADYIYTQSKFELPT